MATRARKNRAKAKAAREAMTAPVPVVVVGWKISDDDVDEWVNTILRGYHRMLHNPEFHKLLLNFSSSLR